MSSINIYYPIVKKVAVWIFFLLMGCMPETSSIGNENIPNPVTEEAEQRIAELSFSECTYIHGSIKIKIVQTKKLIDKFKETENRSFQCSAFIELSKGTNIIKRFNFRKMHPVGYHYGIFVPKVQPASEYFILIKLGDYDGRILLIDKDGVLKNLPGGLFFITENKRYLFSQYSSDDSSFLVFDLHLGKIVYTSTDIPYIHQWYCKNGRYFFTVSEWVSNSPLPIENRNIIYAYDLISHTLSKESGAPWLQGASKQFYDFHPKEYINCLCIP